MSSYPTCIICLEEFKYGILIEGYEVCQDCLVQNIKTRKKLNLYANGGNFPLKLYEKYIKLDDPNLFKELVKICEEEEFKSFLIIIQRFSNEILPKLTKYNFNLEQLNAFIILDRLLQQRIYINECKFIMEPDEEFYQIIRQDFINTINELTLSYYKVIPSDMCNYVMSIRSKYDDIISENVIKRLAEEFKIDLSQRDSIKQEIHKLFNRHFKLLLKSNLDERPEVSQGFCDHCKTGVYYNYKCNACNSVKCRDCGLSYLDVHECDPNDIITYTRDKQRFKHCPKCHVVVEHESGCLDMWCKNCHTMFKWNTLEIITDRHNPDLIEYLNSRNEILVTEVEITPELFKEQLQIIKSILKNRQGVHVEEYKNMVVYLDNAYFTIVKDWTSEFYEAIDLINIPKLFEDSLILNALRKIDSLYFFRRLPFVVNVTREMFEIASKLLNVMIIMGIKMFEYISQDNYNESKTTFEQIKNLIAETNKQISLPLFYSRGRNGL